jgi:hypothetical protein
MFRLSCLDKKLVDSWNFKIQESVLENIQYPYIFILQQIVKASGSDSTSAMAKQIEKDLLRTLPSNACFSTPTSTGTRRLRRILKGLSWLYPDVGYCQGMGMVSIRHDSKISHFGV